MIKLSGFIKSSFYKNGLNLFSGTLIGNLITFGFLPILTRLYTQEEIGINSTLISISSFITVFFSLQLNQSILVQQSKKKYTLLVNVIFIISLVVFMIFLLIFIFFEIEIIKLLNAEIKPKLILLVPLLAFNVSLYNTLRNFFIRENSFNLISKNFIFKSLSNNILMSSFGVLSFGYYGLFFSKVISEIFSNIHLFLKHNGYFKGIISLTKISKVFKQNIKYPTVTLPHSVFTSLSAEVPILFITSYFSPTITGIYFLSIKVSSIPFQIISTSLGNVFFDEFINDSNKLYLFVKRLKEALVIHLIILIPSIVFTYLFIDKIFGYDFGTIGSFTSFLLILFFSKSISSIFGNPVMLHLKKNELNFQFEMYNFITMLISILLGVYFESILIFILLNITTNIFIIIIKLKLCYNFLKKL
jgi:O-antigen/teichoic acid export membrane protein